MVRHLKEKNMKLGIIIETNDAEKSWNAMRLANTASKSGHEVKVFLMGAGVEIETLVEGQYDVAAQVKTFFDSQGKILACGTCLKSRMMDETQVCPISTMMDCLQMIEWADKTVTF
jgi:sulfur relay (sulfurtransferase) complex TusBCD TusD component (DsrE family)